MGLSKKRRDDGWFSDVYVAQYQSIVNYGLRRLGDPEAAAELAQEVFTVAWRRRADAPDHIFPWLCGVARRLLANRWRAERSVGEAWSIDGVDWLAELGSPGPDADVGVADLRAALATLGDLDREILQLVGWEELTVPEAAQVLGCSRTAAAVRLHRARKRLIDAMSRRSVRPAPRRMVATNRREA